MSLFSKLFGKNQKPEKEPVMLHDAYGDFILDEYSWEYECDLNWCGDECTVWLAADDGESKTADQSLEIFHKLYNDAEEWDKKVKEYSAKRFENTDGMIEVWGSSEKFGDCFVPVTRETYLRRLKMSIIFIDESGEISFTLNADEMFPDHEIEVVANRSGEMLSCELSYDQFASI